MRVATIDIGTNAVLLLVAEPPPDGLLRAVAERATITRLGQGVDRSRALAADAVAERLLLGGLRERRARRGCRTHGDRRHERDA